MERSSGKLPEEQQSSSKPADDWKACMSKEARSRLVDKLASEMMNNISPSPNYFSKLQQSATRLEDKIYNVSTSQRDYVRRIALKIRSFKPKVQCPAPVNPIPNRCISDHNSIKPDVDALNASTIGQGTPNISWSTELSNFLLQVLAEMVKLGAKPNKSFAKSQTHQAALRVNERFNKHFESHDIENRIRTFHTEFKNIKFALEQRGARWDKEKKTITMEQETADAFIQGNPYMKIYINRPIQNFELLQLVCGDDEPIGKFHKSNFIDSIEKYAEGHDSKMLSQDQHSRGSNEANSTTLTKRGKRKRESGLELQNRLVMAVEDISKALSNRVEPHWTETLYGKLKEVTGYDEDLIDEVFRVLYDDEKEARLFMLKSLELRRKWFEKFVCSK